MDEYEIHCLSLLEQIGVNPKSLMPIDLVMFLDLINKVHITDYEDSIRFVSEVTKLKGKEPIDRFKYLCGVLHKMKKVNFYIAENED